MRNFNLILAAILGIALMIACGSQKQMVNEVQLQPPQAPSGEVELTIRCVDESYDDAEYFRSLGIGENVAGRQNARTAALQSAKAMFQERLGGFVQGLSTSYVRTIAGDTGESTQRALEGEMTTVVEKMVNDAAVTCEKLTKDSNGRYVSYIAIAISKEEMLNEMSNRISKNEELKIEFNRDQFRKYAEDKMKKMKEAQDAKGR